MKDSKLSIYTLLLIVALACYFILCLINLDTLPAVYEDEPFIAATGWRIATEGKFGSEMLTGFYGIENKLFFYLPIYPIILGTIFQFSGIGFIQARLTTIVLGGVTLLLTYSLGKRLFRPIIGLYAIFFLLLVPLTGTTASQLTGILFMDMARIVRYDMAVPVFALFSLHLYLTGREHSKLWFLGAGFLAGIAGLSHVYGNFWFVVLVILGMFEKERLKTIFLLSSGVFLAWLPYIFYVLSDYSNWVGQTRQYAPRADVLNLNWYWENLISEIKRYGPGLGPFGLSWLTRLGFWSTLLIIPIACILLLRHNFSAPSTRVLLVPAFLIPFLLANFIRPKIANYLLTLYPIWAILWACGMCALGKWAKNHVALWPKLLTTGFFILISLEGITRLSLFYTLKPTTTPYAEWIAEISQHIHANATILGPHRFWFGLESHEFRAWLLPVLQTNSSLMIPSLSVNEAMTQLSPDIILIDDRTRVFLESPPGEFGNQTTAFLDWIDTQEYTLITVMDNPTYGLMEIYSRSP